MVLDKLVVDIIDGVFKVKVRFIIIIIEILCSWKKIRYWMLCMKIKYIRCYFN